MEQLESRVPPGFRFHPTEEELVGYYLKRKINSLKTDLEVIMEIDLYKIEPWDIQGRCKLGFDEKNEWYFFSHKDKKYPTGTRTNRATTAGFWKATGRDKAVISKDKMIGMRKTLVFYKGRAPNGNKTDWIIHEYRMQTSEQGPPQEEGWVVCKAFRKPTPSHRQGVEAWNHGMELRYQSYSTSPAFSVPDVANATHVVHLTEGTVSFNPLLSEEQKPFPTIMDSQIIELPPLESPNTPTISTSLTIEEGLHQHNCTPNEDVLYNDDSSNILDQCLDWKSLDSVLASELRDRNYYQPNMTMVLHDHEMKAQNHVTRMFEYYYPDHNPRKS